MSALDIDTCANGNYTWSQPAAHGGKTAQVSNNVTVSEWSCQADLIEYIHKKMYLQYSLCSYVVVHNKWKYHTQY